jgi:outer membrane lipoprotein-sorting protein
MMNRTGKGIVVLGLLPAVLAALSSPAFAAGFSQPTVEYSAERHISGEGGGMVGKVWSAPGKERMEFERGEAATIIRMDKKLMWTLLPAQKQYMEHRFSEQAPEKRQKGDYRDCDVKQSEIGRETIEGFATRKMTMEMSCPGDEKHTGTIWLTKENIPIRMEASRAGSKKDAVRIELKNLKIGKQDPKLFEIPAGYTKMEIPSLGDVRKMMREQQSRQEAAEKEAAAKEAAREEEAAKRRQQQETGRAYTAQPRQQPAEKSPMDKVIDPAKKLKGILGW